MSFESHLADSAGQITRAVDDLAIVTNDLEMYIDTQDKKLAAAEARAAEAEAELVALKQRNGIE